MHGNILVELTPKTWDALRAISREIFCDSAWLVQDGTHYSLEGAEWVTPGNGDDRLTSEIIAKIIARLSDCGIKALDVSKVLPETCTAIQSKAE